MAGRSRTRAPTSERAGFEFAAGRPGRSATAGSASDRNRRAARACSSRWAVNMGQTSPAAAAGSESQLPSAESESQLPPHRLRVPAAQCRCRRPRAGEHRLRAGRGIQLANAERAGWPPGGVAHSERQHPYLADCSVLGIPMVTFLLSSFAFVLTWGYNEQIGDRKGWPAFNVSMFINF